LGPTIVVVLLLLARLSLLSLSGELVAEGVLLGPAEGETFEHSSCVFCVGVYTFTCVLCLLLLLLLLRSLRGLRATTVRHRPGGAVIARSSKVVDRRRGSSGCRVAGCRRRRRRRWSERVDSDTGSSGESGTVSRMHLSLSKGGLELSKTLLDGSKLGSSWGNAGCQSTTGRRRAERRCEARKVAVRGEEGGCGSTCAGSRGARASGELVPEIERVVSRERARVCTAVAVGGCAGAWLLGWTRARGAGRGAIDGGCGGVAGCSCSCGSVLGVWGHFAECFVASLDALFAGDLA